MNRATILEEIRRNVDLLSVTDQPEYQYIPLHQKPSPSVTALREIMTLLRKVIFPGFFGTEQEAQTDSIQYYTGVYLEQAYDLLQEQIYNGLCFEVERCCDSKDRASEIAIAFINKVPHIKYLLSTDVKAILDGDPAAKSPSEIIFCYPAIHAILYQRVAQARCACDSTYYNGNGPFGYRNRHSSGSANRRIFQYRSWYGGCDRADGYNR